MRANQIVRMVAGREFGGIAVVRSFLSKRETDQKENAKEDCVKRATSS